MFMTRVPSLNGLRAFESVARLMSFKDAATELSVTATAISHQIRQLEEELDNRLFVRGGRAISMTEAGRTLYPDVHEAFGLLQRAADRFDVRDGCRITISTVTSFAVKWLVPRLGKLQDSHPQLDVRITTDLALVDFKRSDIDIGIRYGRGNWPGLKSYRLMAEDLRPICSPTLVANGRISEPLDLANETLLHNTSYSDEWQRWLTMVGYPDLKPTRNLSFDDSSLVLQAAIDGLGVALGRRAFSDADLASGKLVQPFDIHFPQETAFYIVVPEDRAVEKSLVAFRDWILHEADQSGGSIAGA
jgi:LysR family glycine cleavage system transcriptional activator